MSYVLGIQLDTFVSKKIAGHGLVKGSHRRGSVGRDGPHKRR